MSHLDGARPAYRVIERFMNLRSALTGIATGDQAVFVRRDIFRQLGGYAPIALMEDIELSARLKRRRRPALTCARQLSPPRAAGNNTAFSAPCCACGRCGFCTALAFRRCVWHAGTDDDSVPSCANRR